MVASNNYFKLIDNIAKIASNCGRDPKEITLVAVTKGYPVESVEQAYGAGCRDFGENRVQEGLQKIEQAPKDIRWHMIGTLQKNKVRKAVGKFHMIHSVDSYDLAKKISTGGSDLNLTISILLECNTSGEVSKHGFSVEDLNNEFENLSKLPNLLIEGLMTMAPLTDDEKIIRSCFSKLRILKEELNLKHLSMGMTADYPIAIEEGATILRIGTAIFAG